MYERKMAALLFARAIHKTEEFLLASNVDGVGAFDDIVFRYKLKDSDVWKTCFIQLKHKEKEGMSKHKEKEGTYKHKAKGGTIKHNVEEGTRKNEEKGGLNRHKEKEVSIQLSSLINMSGDFRLLKYFDSYCQIKSKASTHQNLDLALCCGKLEVFRYLTKDCNRIYNRDLH
jgi:hypothetical protein